jgi:hypothetical protein
MSESLGPIVEELNNSWRMLEKRWQDTASFWDDIVRKHFEQEYWVYLDSHTRVTLDSMDRVSSMISAARQNVH